MPASFTAQRKAAIISVPIRSSFTITPASNCTTGSTLILFLQIAVNTPEVSTVSDSKGNTWRVDLNAGPGGTWGSSLCVCSSFQTSGLTTADTITVNLSTQQGDCLYWLEEFAGNYSAVDRSASVFTSNSTTAGTGTTAATTAADEFAVCMAARSGSSGTITKNASHTLFTTGQQAQGSGIGAANVWYRILSATGTQNGNGTLSSMADSTGCIVTYKAGTSGTAHTRTPADTLTLTDTLDRLRASTRTPADTVALLDSVKRQKVIPAVFTRSLDLRL